jgi:hypothetical protein
MNNNSRTIVFTLSALMAFAANSILCRKALGAATIDAASFTAVRLISGAVVLWALILIANNRPASNHHGGTWLSDSMLFLYATAFSFAYLKLSAGTGALILFCSVQLTMILYGLWLGERPHALQWMGLFLALGGLIYLVLPGLAAPSPGGSALMAIAGVGWGVYSLRGRGIKDPAAMTAGNFLRTVAVRDCHQPCYAFSDACITEGFCIGIHIGLTYLGRGLSGLVCCTAGTHSDAGCYRATVRPCLCCFRRGNFSFRERLATSCNSHGPHNRRCCAHRHREGAIDLHGPDMSSVVLTKT